MGALAWPSTDQSVVSADGFNGQWLGVLPAICQGSLNV